MTIPKHRALPFLFALILLGGLALSILLLREQPREDWGRLVLFRTSETNGQRVIVFRLNAPKNRRLIVWNGGIYDGSDGLFPDDPTTTRQIRAVVWSGPHPRGKVVEANGSIYLRVIAPEDLAVWRFTVLVLREERNWRGISKRIQDCWNSKSFNPLKRQVIPWSEEQRFLDTEEPITNRAPLSPTSVRQF